MDLWAEEQISRMLLWKIKSRCKNIADAVKKYAENSPIPVVLHLDHGKILIPAKRLLKVVILLL